MSGGGAAGERRVVVRGPRRHPAAVRGRVGAQELDVLSEVGRVYLRALMRAQLRLSLGVCAALGVVVGGLPLAFAVVPALRVARVFGIPLAWLLLGVVVYPVLVAAGWFYVRHAERDERDFADWVGRP